MCKDDIRSYNSKISDLGPLTSITVIVKLKKWTVILCLAWTISVYNSCHYLLV